MITRDGELGLLGFGFRKAPWLVSVLAACVHVGALALSCTAMRVSESDHMACVRAVATRYAPTQTFALLHSHSPQGCSSQPQPLIFLRRPGGSE